MNELGRLEDLPADYVEALKQQNLVPLWPSLRALLLDAAGYPKQKDGKRFTLNLLAAGRLDLPHSYTFIGDFGETMAILGERDEGLTKRASVGDLCAHRLEGGDLHRLVHSVDDHAARLEGEAGVLAGCDDALA